MSTPADEFVGEGPDGGTPLAHAQIRPEPAPVDALMPSVPAGRAAAGGRGRLSALLAREGSGLRLGRRPKSSSPHHIGWPTILAFLLPALVLYATFVLLPIVQSMRFSLFEWNGFDPLDNFVGLDNFRRAFTDADFLDAMKHNGILIGLSLAIQLPVALGLAVLLNQRLRGRAFLRTMFFAPFVLSEVVTAVIWRQIFRPSGMLDQLLTAGGGEGLIYEWLANPDVQLYSVFAVVSWKYFGFHMILMLAGLQQIPKELGEAASIDGAAPRQAFRHVTFPLLMPSIRVSVFLSVIGALQLFDMVWALFGGDSPLGASSTMATHLYREFRRSNYGYASALSIVIFGLSLVVALLYQRFALRRDLEGAGPGV